MRAMSGLFGPLPWVAAVIASTSATPVSFPDDERAARPHADVSARSRADEPGSAPSSIRPGLAARQGTRTEPGVAPSPRGPLGANPPGASSPRNASYSIDAALDAGRRRLGGREVVTWRNTTLASTSELRFHLYWNAWRNTHSTWLRQGRLDAWSDSEYRDRRSDEWGWTNVTAIRLLGLGAAPPIDLTPRRRYIAPDDGNAEDRTVLQVPLLAPVMPGETVNVEIEWEAQVPRTFARTGAIGDYYFLAQWFPKIGVLEPSGWNCHQFHWGTEFYADYGVYDVRLRVPVGWVVGATGREQARRDNGDGTITHRYVQADVHDFAWTTSPRYVERRARFEHGSLPSVEMRLLLQPEHVSQTARHFDATRAALRYYGEWYGPYPYGHITIVDPAWQSQAGGMEYPTLFTAGTRWLAPTRAAHPEGVTIHEAGHQFWYGIVGNNEFEHAWLDEGINEFSTARVIARAGVQNQYLERYFGGFVPWVFRDIPLTRSDDEGWAGYRLAARSDTASTPSWQYYSATGGAITYSKTALWLHTLERHLGWPALQRAMSAFFTRGSFRHPTPDEFFRAVNEASGRDMTWFFDQVYRGSDVFDYGVSHLSSSRRATRGYVEREGRLAPTDGEPSASAPYFTTVVARRFGEAVFPVDLLVTFEDGTTARERWAGRERWKAFTFERPARARKAVVDPDRVLALDVDRTNNGRTLRPATAAASTKWALKWLVWLQDLMMTYTH